MTRLIATFRNAYARWRLNRDLRSMQRLLARRSASINRYVDGGPVWLDVAGFRLYFEGSESPFTVTTYEPEERVRKLVKTHYR